MPAKYCEVCGIPLLIRCERDLVRKRFCSRSCLGKVMGGRNKGISPSVETRQKMRESKLRLVASGWKPVGHLVPNSLKAFGKYQYSKGQRLHRLLVGRPLLPGEEVHHLDRDRGNNDPDNLVIVTRREHSLLHKKEREEAKRNVSVAV